MRPFTHGPFSLRSRPGRIEAPALAAGPVKRHQVRFPIGRSRQADLLLASEVALRRLDGDVAEQELDLIQFTAGHRARSPRPIASARVRVRTEHGGHGASPRVPVYVAYPGFRSGDDTDTVCYAYLLRDRDGDRRASCTAGTSRGCSHANDGCTPSRTRGSSREWYRSNHSELEPGCDGVFVAVGPA